MDSENERRRIRRETDREADTYDSRGSRRERHDSDRRVGDDGRDRGRGRYDDDKEKDSKHRRSRSPRSPRSPARDSTRKRRDDRDYKHSRSRDESPNRRGADKEHRSRGNQILPPKDSARRSREGSASQITRKNQGPLPSQAAAFQGNTDPGALVVAGEQVEKQKPNFGATGLLAAASNSIVSQTDGTTITLKYHEPPEARKPPAKDIWKLFVFKGEDLVETIELSLRSCWLVGRELAVVDLPAEHPSISKQHAVIQFRYIEKKNEYGDKIGKVRPYLIDLESANGTLLDKEPVPASRYLELRNKDMLQFGHSTREYVLMLSPKD